MQPEGESVDAAALEDVGQWGFRPELSWRPEVAAYLSQAYGHSHFEKLSDALSRPPVSSCLRVNPLQTAAADVVSELSSVLEGSAQFGVQGGFPAVMDAIGSNSAENLTSRVKEGSGIVAHDAQNSVTARMPANSGPEGASADGTDSGAIQAEGNILAAEDHELTSGARQLSLSSPESRESALPVEVAPRRQNEQLKPAPGAERHVSTTSAVATADSSGGKLCWEHPEVPGVVLVGGSGPHIINYATEEGGTLKEVAVSRKCGEAVLRGANVFVPGVYACSPQLEAGDEVAVWVVVERPDESGGWAAGITRGAILGSPHAASQLKGYDRTRWFLGRGRAQVGRTALFRQPHGVAVEMIDRVYSHPPLAGMFPGRVFLQNLPSVVAAHALDPQPGERVLDMCAAPGGKTTAIAILMKDQGQVIALDRSHTKVMGITALAEEMGLTCIRAFKQDSLKAVAAQVPAGTYPSAEVPCSATAPSQGHADEEDAEKVLASGSYGSTALPSGLPGSHHREAEEACGGSNPRVELPAAADPESANGCRDAPPGQATTPPAGDENMPAGDDGVLAGTEGRYLSRSKERKAKRRLRSQARDALAGGGGDRAQTVRGGFDKESFDRVLLDAPCSALGLRPRLFAAQVTLEELRKNAVYQRRLFDQAVQLVKPGGTIVYSTCTINPGENEGLVRYALDKYPFLSLAPQTLRLGGPGLVGGADVFDGGAFKEWLREGEQHLVQRFDPTGPHDTIGFFIAKFAVQSQP